MWLLAQTRCASAACTPTFARRTQTPFCHPRPQAGHMPTQTAGARGRARHTTCAMLARSLAAQLTTPRALRTIRSLSHQTHVKRGRTAAASPAGAARSRPLRSLSVPTARKYSVRWHEARHVTEHAPPRPRIHTCGGPRSRAKGVTRAGVLARPQTRRPACKTFARKTCTHRKGTKGAARTYGKRQQAHGKAGGASDHAPPPG